jgi:hypothetical protein
MAKKVRKDGERKEDKKVVFEPPEFDEREYLTEQLHNIRSTLFFIIIAIPMGGAWAYAAATTGLNIAGLAVTVAGYIIGVLFLKSLLGVDLLEGPKRLLATTFLMYLFTSLAFAVVLSNPPVTDITPPSITDVVVMNEGNGTDGDGWDVYMRHRDTLPINKSNDNRIKDNKDQRLFKVEEGTNALEGDNITIMIRAGDASGIESVIFNWGYQEINETPLRMERVSESQWRDLGIDGNYYLWGEHYYFYRLDHVVAGNLNFIITVTDTRGHSITFETEVLADSVHITSP